MNELREKSKEICEEDYQQFQLNRRNLNSTYNNICLKLTYTIVLLDNIFGFDNKINIILPSTQLTSDKEYNILLDTAYIIMDKIPNYLQYLFLIFFLVFLVSYLFKKHMTKYLEEIFFREQLENNKIDLNLLDSTISSLPVKNYLITNCSADVKFFTEKDIFISRSDYKLFFYKMFKKYPGLRDKVNETLILRNQLKSSIILSILQISVIIILSVITTKIIAYSNNYGNSVRCLLVFFSFLYMSLLILECLRLINFIDNRKYMSSDNLSNFDKKFLEEEYEGDNFYSSFG